MKIGDRVTRMLGGIEPMQLVITDITDDMIVCGDYTFDKHTGAEIDKEMGWGPHGTGSFLRMNRFDEARVNE